MEEKEQIEAIQKTIKYMNFCGSCTTGNCKECNRKKSKEFALQAIKKQIPKKLLNYNKIAASGNCPSCMRFVDSYFAYCPGCGQRLEEE